MTKELNIDDKINWYEFYRELGLDIKKRGKNVPIKCCFHDDSSASLSVNTTNGMWNCHAGCGAGNAQQFLMRRRNMTAEQAVEYLKRLAGTWQEKASKKQAKKVENPVTLKDLSEQKLLPIEFLKEQGLIDLAGGNIFVNYRNEEGKLFPKKAHRVRRTLDSGKAKTVAQESGITYPYGLELLTEIRRQETITFVEGETDTLTLRYCGFLALGIPGATNFKTTFGPKGKEDVFLKDILRGIKKVYIHKENDTQGGQTFLDNAKKALAEIGYSGKMFVLKISIEKEEGRLYKDPSDLFVQEYNGNKEDFAGAWQDTLNQAERIDISKEIKEIKEEEKKVKLVFNEANCPVLPLKNYSISEENGIVVQGADDFPRRILSQPLFIKNRVIPAGREEEKITLVFRLDGKYKDVTVPIGKISTPRDIVALADYGMVISQVNAKDVMRYLHEVRDHYFEKLPVVKITSTLGFIAGEGGAYFIPGWEGDYCYRPRDPFQVLRITPKGMLEDWLAKTKEMVWPVFSMRFVLASAFASPLVRLLDKRSFVIHLWGSTGKGKSTSAIAALSAFFNPEMVLETFNSTDVGLEYTFAEAGGNLVVVDEKHSGKKRGQSGIDTIIYNFSSGKSKARGAKDGGLRETVRWGGICVTTGEELLSNERTLSGTDSRMLEFCGETIYSEAELSRLIGFYRENHALVGPIFIKKLLGEKLISLPQLKLLLDDFICFIKEAAPETRHPHAEDVSIVALGEYLYRQWLYNVPEEVALQEAKELILGMLELIKDSDVKESGIGAGQIFYEQAIDWVLGHGYFFDENASGVRYGRKPEFNSKSEKEKLDKAEGCVYILPSAFTEHFVKKVLEMDSTAMVLKAFKKDGFLVIDDKRGRKRNTVKRNFGGVQKRLIALKLPKEVEYDYSGKEVDPSNDLVYSVRQESFSGSDDIPF